MSDSRHPRGLAFSLIALLAALPAVGQPESVPNDPPISGEEAEQNREGDVAEDAPVGAGLSLWQDPLIVTSSGFSQAAFDSPYIIDVIEADEIRDYGYRTMPDALSFTPGVMVQKTGPGQASPYIRGFTGFRNVLLIDGVRLNNSIFRDGPNQYWNTIDPFSIQRLEVVKGPSSVIYGSDAIGGTVNAITRSPFGYGQDNNLSGRVAYRGATNERSNAVRAEISPTFDTTLGVLAGGTVAGYGNLEGGSNVGTQLNTGYDQYAADAKLEYFLSDTTRLVIAHQRIRQNEVPRTHRTVAGTNWQGLTTGTDLKRDLDQERELTYAQLIAEDLDDSFIKNFKASLSWHDQYESRDRITGGGDARRQSVRASTLGFFMQAQSDIQNVTLTYGLDYYHDNVDSYSTQSAIQGPVGDDATYDLFGAFVQADFDFTDRLHATLGGRFNFAAADADAVEDPDTGTQIAISDDWSAFVGSARLVYDVIPEQLHLFGGVSQGFRAPNLSDLTRLDTARTNEIETPSPGLDPEYYTTFEAGLKGQGDRFGWQASYFYTLIDDQIVRFPTGNVIGTDNEVTKANIGDGYVYGIELDGTWKVEQSLTLFGNFTYLLGEVDTFPTAAPVVRREYMDRLMPLTVNLGARVDVPDTPAWFYVTTTLVDKADKLSTRDASDTSRIPAGGTPGYGLVNVGAGYKVNEQLILTATVENLFDKDYRVHGSGLNGGGVGLIFGLEYKF